MLDIPHIAQVVAECADAAELDALHIKYLGRNGEVNKLASKIQEIPVEQRKEYGQKLNQIKRAITELIETRQRELNETSNAQLVSFDTTLPGITPTTGHLHPTTLTIREMVSYFNRLGYSVYESQEIETDEFNFNKMNLPTDHPARELADTLYIHEPEWLLRTHTSSVEARCMTQEKLPIRIVVPGKCYRNESVSMTNNAIFYQLEGLVIDKGIHMGHLRATLEGLSLIHI